MEADGWVVVVRSGSVRHVSSPVQRRIAARRLRSFGTGGIALGVVLIVASVVYLILLAEPVSSRWTTLLMGVLLIAIGYQNLRTGKRQLADLEREHGVGAGSDEELRSRHGL
jgi:uncharacterized membrane protein HdeD (DUF308 family)